MSSSNAPVSSTLAAAILSRPNLLDRFFREDTSAHASLCSCLSPKDLAMLCRTNRFISSEVTAYCRRAFSVDRILQPYFKSPHDFRELQANTGTLISGSAALQFFDRTEYAGSDLDLYVEHRYARQVTAFLLDEGYVFKASPHQPHTLEATMVEVSQRVGGGMFVIPQGDDDEYYIGGGLATVLHFYKGAHDVQVITAHKSPLTVIYSFHSTCVMNIITHEKAYSLFPRATFETRKALVVDHSRTGKLDERARNKYVSRGWEMVYDPRDQTEFFQGGRWIGDSATWTIQLTPCSDFPPDYREINSFSLLYFEHQGPILRHFVLEDRFLHQNVVCALHWDERSMIGEAIAKIKTETEIRSLIVGKDVDERIDKSLSDCIKKERSRKVWMRSKHSQSHRVLANKDT